MTGFRKPLISTAAIGLALVAVLGSGMGAQAATEHVTQNAPAGTSCTTHDQLRWEIPVFNEVRGGAKCSSITPGVEVRAWAAVEGADDIRGEWFSDLNLTHWTDWRVKSQLSGAEVKLEYRMKPGYVPGTCSSRIDKLIVDGGRDQFRVLASCSSLESAFQYEGTSVFPGGILMTTGPITRTGEDFASDYRVIGIFAADPTSEGHFYLRP